MRLTRRPHPRAGRRLTAVPTLPPPPATDGPREHVLTQPLQRIEDAPVPDGLPADRARKLEWLAESWRVQARIPGHGEDATMFYVSTPKPPPPVAGRHRAASDGPGSAELPPPAPIDVDWVPPGHLADDPRTRVRPEPAPAPRVVRDWASRHDPLSLSYDVASRLRQSVGLQDRIWEIGPVLDQGTTPPLTPREASGCVGFAVAAAANAAEIALAPPYVKAREVPGLLTRDDALSLYDRAQELDDWPGKTYPGTSVLAGMLAGREAGLFAGFLWCFGTGDIAQAIIQVGPVVLGLPWGPALDAPDADGVITPDGNQPAGHAIACVGFVATRAGRPGPWFALQQSRGPGHGRDGLVYVHAEHLGQLLAGVGEAAVPLPRYASGVLR